MMAMTQHEQTSAVRVVSNYELDTLGAPFKVVLLNGVTFDVNPLTGEEKVNVCDLPGLIRAVVRSRVTHPRKLNGAELRFVRHALGVKAKSLAEFLEISPEHFSRCESGQKVMSASSEKVFRLYAYFASYTPDPEKLLEKPEKLLEKSAGGPEPMPDAKMDKIAKDFINRFMSLRIQNLFNPNDELCFEFRRGSPERECPECGIEESCNDNDGGGWTPLAA
jgi:DNA-binding transcriptional regulator YiaG